MLNVFYGRLTWGLELWINFKELSEEELLDFLDEMAKLNGFLSRDELYSLYLTFGVNFFYIFWMLEGRSIKFPKLQFHKTMLTRSKKKSLEKTLEPLIMKENGKCFVPDINKHCDFYKNCRCSIFSEDIINLESAGWCNFTYTLYYIGKKV